MKRFVAAVLGAALVAVASLPASAQEAVGVRIRETSLDADGFVRLIISVSGPAADRVLAPENFRVTEEGAEVSGLEVEALIESKVQPVAVALLIDVSGSTRGQPLADAKGAAKSFVAQLPEGVRVALLAFGPVAELRADFTTDKGLILSTIDSLEAGGETALYDAVVLASTLLGRVQAQRNMVVFSDGADTVSQSDLRVAIDSAVNAGSPITSVGLVTPEFDQAPLDALAAETEGRTLSVFQSGDLLAAFSRVAREIASQYVLTYTASRYEPKELNIVVHVDFEGVTTSDTVTVLNPRVKPPPDRPKIPGPTGVLTSRTGLYVGVFAAFFALLLLLSTLIRDPRAGAGARVLRRGLSVYARRRVKDEDDRGIASTGIGRRVVEMVDSAPKPKGFDERLQSMLERAGWPVRSSEFLILQATAAFTAALVGFGLFGNPLLGILLPVTAVWTTRVILKRAIDKRASAFLAQLPDTLQLLSGSMQAGYGLLQALDTVTKETGPPTGPEFSRVLSEARLGMSLEDALDSMAERLGSEDFMWVVMAIKIQKQVGGNLAQLLNTVAQTLREREQVRRQVKVLSAEGRLSGIILTILPFGLGLYLAVVNPSYLKDLFTHPIGLLMLGGGAVAMFFGVIWMRKIVRIEV